VKFIGINGSPNKSNTYYMIQTILEASGADFEIIQLSEKDINPCYDCK
jgi:multimeric flavodoxin WrbA